MGVPVSAAGTATATKLHVLAAHGCECRECVFIRNAYACVCTRCGQHWQAAYATSSAAHEGMARHSQECLAEQEAREHRRRQPRPAWYPASCGWCGESWPERFRTQQARARFLRAHTQMCFLLHTRPGSALAAATAPPRADTDTDTDTDTDGERLA